MPIFINLPNDVIGSDSKGIQSPKDEELDKDGMDSAAENDTQNNQR